MVIQMQTTVDEKVQVFNNIIKIYRALQRELNRRLGNLNLNYLDFLVLRAVSDGPKSMISIANRYFVTQASITSSVDKLESIGAVKRTRSKEDRRVILVEITEKGKEIYDEGIRLYRELVEEILRGMKEEEVKELLDKLNYVLSRLENI